MLSDAALLASPEPRALGAFYDRHSRAVIALLARSTRSAEVAADLAAETFAVVLEQRSRFDPSRGTARQWLGGIARNLLFRYFRTGSIDDRARRRVGVEPAFSEEDLARVESLIDLESAGRLARQQLDELTPAIRSALVLRVVDELSYEEVASRLGCGVDAARKRVERGLAQLRAVTVLGNAWSAATVLQEEAER